MNFFYVILFAGMTRLLMAAPYYPMNGFEPTDIASRNLNVETIWNSMHSEMKGKDCYKRAHIWSYDLFNLFGIKSKKIFIHYSNKWNRELDDLGGLKLYGGFLGTNALKRKTLKFEGVSKREMSVIHGNKRWVYHVATVVVENGKDIALDRTLRLAYDADPDSYTDDEAWNLYTRPSTPTEWAEALSIRGEILWKIRKAQLKEELEEASSYERAQIVQKMKSLEMINDNGSENERINISCKKVDSIAEADKYTNDEWCFWTEAPMYYWNEIDLRYLAFGNTGYNYNIVTPRSIQREENYLRGRQYIQTSFDEKEVKMSQSEKK
tara:strand:- start:1210 stop:2178 length:969 start_codon:yes stop_codon:yes gene_type:complete